VLVEVDSSFALFVPLETHDFSVRTLCAYVKQEAESAWRVTGAGARSTDLANSGLSRLPPYPKGSASGDRPLSEAPAFRNLALQLAPAQKLAA
jgi:hypothetical protein